MSPLVRIYRCLDALHVLAFGPALLGGYWLLCDQLGDFGWRGRISSSFLATLGLHGSDCCGGKNALWFPQ